MADILKISTPLIDKLPMQATRPVADPSIPFDLSDVTRVIQTTDPTEILQQNTGYVPKENETPTILADLLSDPTVTASIIRNIYMLEEVLNLLPANNAALTEEVEQLFSQLMLSPDELVQELMNQEKSTTLFKGELFDQLRNLLTQHSDEPGLATSVGILLKSLNATIARRDALNSVANNLSFILNDMQQAFADNGFSHPPALFDKLETLISAFRAPDAPAQYQALKNEAMALFGEIESSLLFSPQAEKILPLVMYNLSRFNNNDDFMQEALNLLLHHMNVPDSEKQALVQRLQAFIDRFSAPEGAKEARESESDSQVMQALSKIIGREAREEDVQLLSGDKLNRIVHSMLSSPSNFTPLLHFIVPVQTPDIRAFAEIWLDPNAEEQEKKRRGDGDAMHMLAVFDVEGVGRFESDLYVHTQSKRISLSLFCPAAHMDAFRDLAPAIRRAVLATGYSFETINIDRLTHTHSLMEVFHDLPHKRTGIDVKV